ncbi:hypothetical protein Pint_26233 [Pistacia integerrima]|uniref:Uncharacterized protein n=1 Tax=Pistacia integerrima TaxID=434235 RepID=A0ACC0YE23_9ROSI|nr:hypothetical protein Pint_26233 [Pistacia integerrima]
MYLVFKRISMQGFVVFDYCSVYPKFLHMVLPYIRDGKIIYLEDQAEELVNSLVALVGIFSGRNIGKQVMVLLYIDHSLIV